jgi:large subunit ribosomal protein L35Ae
MSQPVYGRIMNYRIGIKTQMASECLIQLTDVASPAQSGQLMGQKVLWKGEKKKFIGKIVGFHGKKGVVRVKFKKGVPGQALGAIVELIG